MKYYRIQPPVSISRYVKYFWVGEVEASAEDQFTHFSVASGSSRIVFHYKGQFDEVISTGERVKSLLSGIEGQSKTHKTFVSRNAVGIFGIEFFPYAIPALFSIPAIELTNQYIDLETFLGSKGKELEEKIFSATSDVEKVIIVTRFLESNLAGSPDSSVIEVLHQIHQSMGNIHIHNLVKQFHLSQRQFERLFKHTCGLSPKSYAKILRFEHALSRFKHSGSFTEIAMDSGYFDQSHFIRDFREFTGLQPQTYFAAIANLPAIEC